MKTISQLQLTLATRIFVGEIAEVIAGGEPTPDDERLLAELTVLLSARIVVLTGMMSETDMRKIVDPIERTKH